MNIVVLYGSVRSERVGIRTALFNKKQREDFNKARNLLLPLSNSRSSRPRKSGFVLAKRMRLSIGLTCARTRD